MPSVSRAVIADSVGDRVHFDQLLPDGPVERVAQGVQLQVSRSVSIAPCHSFPSPIVIMVEDILIQPINEPVVLKKPQEQGTGVFLAPPVRGVSTRIAFTVRVSIHLVATD